VRVAVLLLAFGTLSIGWSASAASQLRPYDPIAWEMYDGGTALSAKAGVAALYGQRIALLGTEGTLMEVGAFRASWRSGPIVLDATGVPWRSFTANERYAPADGDVEPHPDEGRSDSGDYLVSTTVGIGRARAPLMAAVRFGTRLPTTNNRVGLERDQTDFFAMGGARWQNRSVRVAGEIGLGLHGTRNREFEQSDVVTYGFVLGLRRLPLLPEFSIVGHADGLPDRAILGNEELSEARLRLRTGGDRWAELQFTRGLTDFSPRFGVAVSAGITH
jgi:hypothetical protein